MSKTRVLALIVALPLIAWSSQAHAQLVNVRDQRPVQGGPSYGDLLRVFLESQVFPPELNYKGVGVRRDRVIVRYIKTNGRGGFWFNAYARYSGSIPPFGVGVAERVTLQYDNGGVRVDLGGLKGVLNTRAVGKWLADNLRPDTQIDPVPQGRRIEVRYTIVNNSNGTVRFKMVPSGREYGLAPGDTFKGRSWDFGKPPQIIVQNSGRTYNLRSGEHKFFWNSRKNRIGFDMNYRRD